MDEKNYFYGSRDDLLRAKMFDNLVRDEETAEDQQNKMTLWVAILKFQLGIEEEEAKALLASIIAYDGLHADEKDYCLARADVIRASMKWKAIEDKPLPYNWKKKDLPQ